MFSCCVMYLQVSRQVDKSTSRQAGKPTSRHAALLFSVIAPNGMVRKIENVVEDENKTEVEIVQDEPWWTALLRLASGMKRASERASAITPTAPTPTTTDAGD